MENPNETEDLKKISDSAPSDSAPISSAQSVPVKPRARRVDSNKPSVEGINAPRVQFPEVTVEKSPLTEQEKKLIVGAEEVKPQETKLMPQIVINRAQQQPSQEKKSKAGTWVFIGILVLLAAGYYYVLKPQLPQSWKFWQKSATTVKPNPPAQENATANTVPTGQPATTTNPSTIPAEPLSPTTTASSTPNTVPVKQNQIKVNSTPTGYLNVRSEPSTGSKIITKIHPGEIYPFTQSQNGWYEITLPDGQTGWVAAQYVTVQK